MGDSFDPVAAKAAALRYDLHYPDPNKVMSKHLRAAIGKIDELEVTLEDEEAAHQETLELWQAAKAQAEELRSLHEAGCREAYRICGVEDDGEYRWKWVLLELSRLKRENKELNTKTTHKRSDNAGD